MKKEDNAPVQRNLHTARLSEVQLNAGRHGRRSEAARVVYEGAPGARARRELASQAVPEALDDGLHDNRWAVVYIKTTIIVIAVALFIHLFIHSHTLRERETTNALSVAIVPGEPAFVRVPLSPFCPIHWPRL